MTPNQLQMDIEVKTGASLSDQIRKCREGVVRNPFQGTDKKVLFVCSMGILRSATGARLYAGKYNTRSAGTWDDALIPLTTTLLAWADEIVFMNQENFLGALKVIPEELFIDLNYKVLDIPDNHPHMHPELIKAFEEQYEPLAR
jgi:predicted protein tyrosine phosphatase